MTKTEELVVAAKALSDEQLEGLIAFTRQLASEPWYDTAPPEVLAAIDRGIADADAGRLIAGEKVFRRLSRKIAASQS